MDGGSDSDSGACVHAWQGGACSTALCSLPCMRPPYPPCLPLCRPALTRAPLPPLPPARPAGSESDSDSSSSSSSDEEGEGGRRAATRRRGEAATPEAQRRQEALRRQIKDDKRRAEELSKAAKKEEKRLRKEAEQAGAVGSGAGAPLRPGQHSPSELPYPAAVGGADDGEGEKSDSWLLGELLR